MKPPSFFRSFRRRSIGWLAGLLAPALVVSACRTAPAGEPDPGGASPPTDSPRAEKAVSKHLEFVRAPEGDVPAVVQAAVAKAARDGRRVIVYEGATWCEPCQNFHAAAAKGELDAAFPNLTLLEFDADRDRERLVAAGYGSQYIPLFALPGKDGRAAGPKAAGGIKGDSVVPYLTKKLETLLSQGS